MRSWIRHSFKNRIFVTVLLVTLLPLLFCDVLVMQVQRARSESSLATQAQAQLNGLEQALDTTCLSYRQAAKRLCGSTMIRNALNRKTANSRVVYQLLFMETDRLREHARFDIFSSEGKCLYSTVSPLPEEERNPRWGVLYAAGQTDGLAFGKGTGQTAMTAAQAVRGYGGRILGYVVITMTSTDFERLFEGLYSATHVVILLDPTWQTIYHTQPAQAESSTAALRSQLLAGKPLTGADGEYYYFLTRNEGTGLSLILQQPKTFSSQVMDTFYTVSILMGLMCLLLCLWCAWLLSRHLSQPVHQLDEAMGEIKKGNLEIHMETDREDELGRLTESFNRMTEEYRQNLVRSVARQRELNETQLRMMQAQLNPHFLYNTLDSMKWLGVTHHVPQVATLATDLAVILRAGISGSEFITLEDELELVDRYIDIQSLRFEDRFTCEIDVPDRLQSCLVPKLVLQPLVENAIIHGVVDREDGYIKLQAEEQEGDLLLAVYDNGCGVPPDVLARLNSEDQKIPGEHLGLFNVSSIIRLHFGEKYGISAETTPGDGSCVRLLLPIQKKENNNA